MAISQSDPTELPLLRTKISIPQIPSGFVTRSRLTEKVHRGVKGALVLVAAPAGFGKTHLLLEWAKETDLPVAWLTLDSNDNDLNRFFRYLLGSLQILQAGLGDEALIYTQSSTGDGLEAGLTLLINELSALSNEISLVLDDFQVIENPLVLKGIGFLLQYLPANLHLVIASRSEPEINLAFLRAKNQLVEIDADDLRFTDEEVDKYFQLVVGLHLPSETIQTLEKHTDGWITPLQMAAISLNKQADAATFLSNLQGKAHYLTGFLAEEILDRQPEEIRQFLLRSSILESMTGPLCESVVNPDAQPGYGAVLLNQLEHNHLFITALDEKHEWFRYHPLFSDFLLQVEVEVNPDEIPTLHKRAAIWLEENNYLAEAFGHALVCRDMKWAADLIERNVLPMINMGEVSTLARSISRLPDDITRQRPLLMVAYAWSLIVTNNVDVARFWLDELRLLIGKHEDQTTTATILDHLESTGEPERINWPIIQGGLALCESHLAMASGDMKHAAELSQRASSFFQEVEPYFSSTYFRSIVAMDDSISSILSGDTQKAIGSLRTTIRIARQANNQYAMIVAGCALADMQALQGQLSKAWETYQRVQFWSQGPGGKPLPLSGLVDVGLGEILLEHDLLEEARDYLERGIQITQSMWYFGSLHGMIALTRLRQAMGNITGALEAIEEAARMALSAEAMEWDGVVAPIVAIRLALQRDDLATAELWWRKAGFPDLNTPIALEKYPYHVFEYLLLTQARFLLIRGQQKDCITDIRQAAELLETLLPPAEYFIRVSSEIQILILQAMVQFTLQNEEATKVLIHALALGEPEGFRRYFLDEGVKLFSLLRKCRSLQQASGSHFPSIKFIDSLLEAIQRTMREPELNQPPVVKKASPTIAKLEDGFPISLSMREMEVLALIAEGNSNQEISAKLYLALNTVKRHVYNIYVKLEVKKRTQAVSKARQLRLIP